MDEAPGLAQATAYVARCHLQRAGIVPACSITRRRSRPRSSPDSHASLATGGVAIRTSAGRESGLAGAGTEGCVVHQTRRPTTCNGAVAQGLKRLTQHIHGIVIVALVRRIAVSVNWPDHW